VIVRQRRAWTTSGREADYLACFEAVTLPELRSVRGFLGTTVLRCVGDDGVEITVLTRWESEDTVRSWAGDDPTSAVVNPGTHAAVDRYDHRAVHHDLVYEE
jgi:heme-degrading monooxygenase HmoA